MTVRFLIIFIVSLACSMPAVAQTENQPPPPQAPTSPPVPLNDFQQWLKNNGYAPASTAPAVAPTALATPTPPNAVPSLVPPPQPSKAASQPPRNPPPPPSRPLTFEESQKAMLDTAPSAGRPISPDAVAAFNAMMQQNMPLTPRQVVQLRQQIDTSQRAAAIPPTIPPKPVSTTIMVNLAPGTTPPAIRLAQGYVSSLVFVDSTGSPWPIAAFDIGNPKSVNIQWDGKSNIILLQAVAPYTTGNMVIRLVGLPTPISLELVAGQRVVDYRVDIHVSGIGPNTKDLPLGTGLPDSANQLLLNILDGIAPAGSRLLTVRGADAQAWLLADKIYLRTRFTVLSPGWTGTMVSPDGMHAYELPKTSSVLISRYGDPAELKIEGL